MGRCLELHIPLTADLFEVLDKAELGRRPTAMAAGKPVDWTCTLKVAKGVVGSRAFQDGMVGRMLLHLSEWLAINSVTISFPEMAVPVLAELQRACRSAKVARFHRQMKNLIATVSAQCRRLPLRAPRRAAPPLLPRRPAARAHPLRRGRRARPARPPPLYRRAAPGPRRCARAARCYSRSAQRPTLRQRTSTGARRGPARRTTPRSRAQQQRGGAARSALAHTRTALARCCAPACLRRGVRAPLCGCGHSVREFEKAFAARGETPLQQLVREEKRAAEVRDAQFGNGVVGESDESDDDEDASDEEGGARPSRKQRRAAGSDEDDDDSEGEGAPSKRADQGKGKGKAKGKAKGKRDVDAQAAAPVRARLVNPGSEDVVREFDAREFFS